MKEEWRAVTVEPFTEFYDVSSLGRVRSKDRFFINRWGTKNYIRGIIMALSVDTGGYHSVALSHQGKQKRVTVHRLVMYAFVNNLCGYPVINHKNGVKTDNSVHNLEWCTALQNTMHAFRHGLRSNIGNKHPYSKLTNFDIIEIRRIWGLSKHTQTEISIIFGISRGHVSSIVTRKVWAHI